MKGTYQNRSNKRDPFFPPNKDAEEKEEENRIVDGSGAKEIISEAKMGI